MSIETLMSAANAAGYVMAAEEELPENFGAEPTVLSLRHSPRLQLRFGAPSCRAWTVSRSRGISRTSGTGSRDISPAAPQLNQGGRILAQVPAKTLDAGARVLQRLR